MLNARTSVIIALGGAFLLGALAVAYSSARGDSQTNASHPAKTSVDTSFSDAQEEDIGKIVRAYLLENPEVILEAVETYRVRQMAQAEEFTRNAAAENIARLTDPETAYVAGKAPDKAKVAVIEMYDYHCTYCKQSAGVILEMLRQDPEVKVIFRELPILREESEYAAEMSLAARDQGKFVDFHFAMLEAQGVLTKDRVEQIAKKQGLDVDKMKADVASGRMARIVDDNHALAQMMAVDGTPAFIIAAIDGSYVGTLVGYSEQRLREEIKAAKKAAG